MHRASLILGVFLSIIAFTAGGARIGNEEDKTGTSLVNNLNRGRSTGTSKSHSSSPSSSSSGTEGVIKVTSKEGHSSGFKSSPKSPSKSSRAVVAKEEPKREEPKREEPKRDEPKREEPKKEKEQIIKTVTKEIILFPATGTIGRSLGNPSGHGENLDWASVLNAGLGLGDAMSQFSGFGDLNQAAPSNQAKTPGNLQGSSYSAPAQGYPLQNPYGVPASAGAAPYGAAPPATPYGAPAPASGANQYGALVPSSRAASGSYGVPAPSAPAETYNNAAQRKAEATYRAGAPEPVAPPPTKNTGGASYEAIAPQSESGSNRASSNRAGSSRSYDKETGHRVASRHSQHQPSNSHAEEISSEAALPDPLDYSSKESSNFRRNAGIYETHSGQQSLVKGHRGEGSGREGYGSGRSTSGGNYDHISESSSRYGGRYSHGSRPSSPSSRHGSSHGGGDPSYAHGQVDGHDVDSFGSVNEKDAEMSGSSYGAKSSSHRDSSDFGAGGSFDESLGMAGGRDSQFSSGNYGGKHEGPDKSFSEGRKQESSYSGRSSSSGSRNSDSFGGRGGFDGLDGDSYGSARSSSYNGHEASHGSSSFGGSGGSEQVSSPSFGRASGSGRDHEPSSSSSFGGSALSGSRSGSPMSFNEEGFGSFGDGGAGMGGMGDHGGMGGGGGIGGDY